MVKPPVLIGALALSAIISAQAPPPSTTQSYAFGRNDFGQAIVPPLPSPGVEYVKLSGDVWHSTALRSDGQIVAWGRNDEGQCDVPALPPGMSYVEVSAGRWHTLALRSDGAIIGWGRNTDGQCDAPPLPAGATYVEIAAGGFHSVALRSDGTAIAWGQNYDGQCDVPPLSTGQHFSDISAGMLHTLACKADGTLSAWGDNTFGQCNTPPSPLLAQPTVIDSGTFHNVVLFSNGEVKTFGSNSSGQSTLPPAPPDGEIYCELAAGSEHNLALTNGGRVTSWGNNQYGQLSIPPAADFVEVALGGDTSLVRGIPIPATVTPYGQGCPASAPLAVTSARPVLGTPWQMTASAIDPGVPLAVFVLGSDQLSPALDLTAFGAPGCFVYSDGAFGAGVEPAFSGISDYFCSVPNDLFLVGTTFNVQAAAPSNATPIGFATSNGLEVSIGY